MQNFRFSLTTNVLFGRGQVQRLPAVLSGFGKKVLLTYGGGSIHKTGLYDTIMGLLAGFEVFELSGIDPNPKVESVEAGARICREKGIDVILAVGGGSVIDCSKAIAAAAFYDGPAWEMIMKASNFAGGADAIRKALPLCTVLTLAATGSEVDSGAVISNSAEKVKTCMFSPLVVPKCSVLDPEYTYTVPASQTAAGAADILSHIFEVYFCHESTDIANGVAEGVMKTVIKNAPIALAQPDHYDARANLMWASSVAMIGLCSSGNPGVPWSCHSMEHELSAYYDITHGVGLAILTPRWMRYILSDATADKFAEFGINVWGIDASLNRMEIAARAIDKTEEFFAALGLPKTLSELGIGQENLPAMAAHSVQTGGLAFAYVPLNEEDVVRIFKMCL